MEVKMTAKDLTKSEEELATEYENERVRNIKKLILLENLDEVEFTPARKKKFIKYFYENIEDMNFTEALEKFKKL